MGQITTLRIIESMDRELNSIDKELTEAFKIEDADEREAKISELFNEWEMISLFYQNIMNTVMKSETMNVDANGQLVINS